MDREITITLSEDEARMVEQRVASGEYGNESDVVRAALSVFEGDQARTDSELERRLDSVRSRVRSALSNPLRHSSQDIRTHIAKLSRAAEDKQSSGA